MMFNVRCLKCQNSIGKGVRFNAHKKNGKYTSILFTMFSRYVSIDQDLWVFDELPPVLQSDSHQNRS